MCGTRRAAFSPSTCSRTPRCATSFASKARSARSTCGRTRTSPSSWWRAAPASRRSRRCARPPSRRTSPGPSPSTWAAAPAAVSTDPNSAKPVVMGASGTGFAPIKAMCEAAFEKNLARPITLYWGCRARRDLYMLDVLQQWSRPNFRFVPVLSDPTPECRWRGRTGFVHRAVMEDFPDLSGVEVYACGAPVMVDAARADFGSQRGLPPEAFFADSFLTEADKLPAS